MVDHLSEEEKLAHTVGIANITAPAHVAIHWLIIVIEDLRQQLCQQIQSKRRGRWVSDTII